MVREVRKFSAHISLRLSSFEVYGLAISLDVDQTFIQWVFTLEDSLGGHDI